MCKLANNKRSRTINYPITVHIRVPKSGKSPTYSIHQPERPQPSANSVNEMPYRTSSESETSPLLARDARTQYWNSDRLPYYTQDLPGESTTRQEDDTTKNAHSQFCALTGCPPSNLTDKDKFHVPKKSLYGRTVAQLTSQRRVYNLSASINNILLLSQVILGAALTALGASASSHILITIFGATNTIIAGLVAYLKSRGQPMRARMYRDDLERIVDEIENSEVMWRGISERAHGYNDIDTDDVTVRSEVARLTRLYDRAIRLNGMNNPDMYMAGAGGLDKSGGSGLRSNRGAVGGNANATLPAVGPTEPQPSAPNPGPSVPIATEDPEDIAPATKADHDKPESQNKDAKQDESTEDKGKQAVAEPPNTDGASDSPAPSSDPPKAKTAPSAPAPAPEMSQVQAPETPIDPDASPATVARLKPKRNKSDKARESDDSTKKVAGDNES